MLLASLLGASVWAGPVVPGFDRLAADPKVSLAARGELLLGELNCLSCHTASEAVLTRIPTKSAPRLDQAGERLTPAWLRSYLAAPHDVKPGTTMPDVFHASEAASRDGAVEFLVHYLVSLGGPIKASQTAVNRSAAEAGKELFHSVGCVACHAPEDPTGITTPMVPLPKNLAAKTTVEHLALFLKNPLHTRPSGRMPSLGLTDAEAKLLAMYLLRGQMDSPQSEEAQRLTVAGWQFDYYDLQGNPNNLPDYSRLKPAFSGTAPEIGLNPPGLKRADNKFALRFQAQLDIKKSGQHTFWLKSDDGSRLLIDGQAVIENDGIHPANEKRAEIELSAGAHAIEVQYFEGGGEEELSLTWKPAVGKRGPLPKELVSIQNQVPMIPPGWEEFKSDPEKVRMGKMMFGMLRCVSCHQQEGIPPSPRPAPALAGLRLDSSSGCLGANPARAVPNYRFTADQRAALLAALQDRQALAAPLPPEQRVQRTLASLNCLACHKRDGIGGPDDQRATLFHTKFEIDLGEEGSLPPTLNQVGSKLKRSALESVLEKDDLHIRYFMSTRMPRFGADNLKTLVDDLVAVDAKPDDTKAPAFSEESMEVGRRLLGQNGLFCINCHLVNGGKGPGIPGIDLGMAHKRLNPGWFQTLLLNPAAINAGTRMPAFWPEGQSALPDVLGGNSTAQIAAIWNFLSLGESMPTPAGIQVAGGVGEELVPTDRPIIHRTFMTEVGPRSILAGFPEKVHVAFDANVVRLAKAWRGRFFDASGVSSGRTDKFMGPLGSDAIDLPDGPAIATLASETDPWPKAEKTDRDTGGQFEGYRLDEKGRPAFLYTLRGVEISEGVEPVLSPGGSSLIRHFALVQKAGAGNFYLLAATGMKIDSQAGQWVIDGKQRITIQGTGAGSAFTRPAGKETELLVPVRFTGGRAEIQLHLKW